MKLLFDNATSTPLLSGNHLRRPLVTVGICVRNCESCIKAAIDSVLDQAFPQELIEIIVVDDGSDDQTLSIALDLLMHVDLQVKIFHSEWRGLGATRNTVVSNAQGDYIIWVDGDMILPSSHVQEQVNFMKENPNVAIAKATHGILENESFLVIMEHSGFVAVDFRYRGETERLPGTGGAVYRVEAIKQVGGFDNQVRGVGEDQELASRIRKAGWKIFLGTPAIFYERHRRTWKDLWSEYFWHGNSAYRIVQMGKRAITFHKMVPPAGFIAGVTYSIIAYRVLRLKRIFLLPIQYTFKRIAWSSGFLAAQVRAHLSRRYSGRSYK